MKCENYPGICLLNIAYKNVLTERLKLIIKVILFKEQAGFIGLCIKPYTLLTLYQIIEKSHRVQQKHTIISRFLKILADQTLWRTVIKSGFLYQTKYLRIFLKTLK